MATNCPIREMTFDDYAEVHGLWKQTEGLCMEEDDRPNRIALYLRRNPGLCFVAVVKMEIVGTVLCGHDGRRAILRHLAVKPAFRKKGIARALIRKSLGALARQGIRKCNLHVEDHNPAGLQFWKHLGWRLLKDDYRTLQTFTRSSR